MGLGVGEGEGGTHACTASQDWKSFVSTPADRNSPGLTRSSPTSGCPYVARMPRHLVIFPPGCIRSDGISSSWLSVGFPFRLERKRRKRKKVRRGTTELETLLAWPASLFFFSFYFSLFTFSQSFNIAIRPLKRWIFASNVQWFNHDYKLVRLYEMK